MNIEDFKSNDFVKELPKKNKTNNRDEEIKLTSMIFLAQWIINSEKGYGVDITRILEQNCYKVEKER